MTQWKSLSEPEEIAGVESLGFETVALPARYGAPLVVTQYGEMIIEAANGISMKCWALLWRPAGSQ
jgi:hypothetical protein